MFDANEVTPGPGSVQNRRPYPEFTKIQEIGNVAEARYNSLALKLTRRLDRGFSVLVGYTLSKSEDNGSGIRVLNGDALFPQNSNCFECEWGLSIFDVRHRLVTSVLYELPFGPGKPLAETAWLPRDPGRLAGQRDRQQVQRLPAGIRPSASTSPTPAPRPTVRTSCRARIPTTGRRRCSSGSIPTAFVAPRRLHLRQRRAQHRHRTRHLHHGRVALRNIIFGGGRALQLRLEAFNAFNQPVWGDPDMNMSSPTYGRINTTRSPMRELQIGVKFSF